MGARAETLAAAAEAALRDRGLQVRTLARDLAADPEADTPVVETWRRQVYRVLGGGTVEDPVRRRLLADRLGLTPELLAPEPRAARRNGGQPAQAALEERVEQLEQLLRDVLQAQRAGSEQVADHSERLGLLERSVESLEAERAVRERRRSAPRSV